MLDSGSNIHVIKTLLGHSKLETTKVIYLHLQKHTQAGIISPLDHIVTSDASACRARLSVYYNKIFGHNDVLTFNPYSQMVFRKLSKCHTIGLGDPHTSAIKPLVNMSIINIIVVVTGTALIVVEQA
ncbi:MAG: hypothetical protein M9911_13115 [Saprospiraceae bacterium]|nr:hypothetical protein [Saprospiraceae bacterium]